MQNKTQKLSTFQISLAGIMGALCLVLMLMGSLIPALLYTAPAICGFAVAVVGIEAGRSAAWLLYATVGILSLLLVPEKEMAFIFIGLLGFYPLVQAALNRIKPTPLRFLLKSIIFNTLLLAVYCTLFYVLQMPGVVNEFYDITPLFLSGLLLLANITFWVYDLALKRCFTVYNKSRHRLLKRLR